ncbi:MAG: hypothetical protein US30_C0007G0020 [Candidatus Moranbacteria bacterium GW2011_GWF2_36_839]|nr:MAG: hypothetical protein US27_C0007G0030 [Candidatus Moranbacteria bacterium GW2011_GWF1_36_78]KKQ17074.1 MAG: hypothetical protein US30_C0007G0020 [Candidatus Moranbacteria bacterium GW2011_GWF2_36_839]HAT73677.1 hypothetical protein [Candidatus Moranbacteria bacterium]HBY11347.1 hypothetical protein [Candidatus Moranbacteria bacterium]
MTKKQKIIIAVLAIAIMASGFYFFKKSNPSNVKKIDLNKIQESAGPANTGPVSPISGISCEAWNRRPVAVMQPSDLQARPAAGFSEADMVVEMPAYTSSVTRLMGVYICNIPKEIGAIRSSRHDYIAIASGLNAFFIHWGGSHFALDLLNKNVIDHIDCMNTNYCARWPVSGIMRLEDTGHIAGEKVLEAMKNLKLDMTDKFSGYAHQEEASIENRPSGGHLRVAFAKPYDVEYDYDKNSNSYLRTWGEKADTDRNNNQRLAPKNVVVMFAKSEQIVNTKDYKALGMQDPWADVEVVKNTGAESISGRYNNVEIGDPWYDETDSGPAKYYFNGKEYEGVWKKDKSKIDSKLAFFDNSGTEIKFVPGQIWVEILEPGQNLEWEPAS